MKPSGVLRRAYSRIRGANGTDHGPAAAPGVDDAAAVLLDPAHNARCRKFYMALSELLRRYEQPPPPEGATDARMPLTG